MEAKTTKVEVITLTLTKLEAGIIRMVVGRGSTTRDIEDAKGAAQYDPAVHTDLLITNVMEGFYAELDKVR